LRTDADNTNAMHFSKNVFYIHIDVNDSPDEIRKKSSILNEVLQRYG